MFSLRSFLFFFCMIRILLCDHVDSETSFMFHDREDHQEENEIFQKVDEKKIEKKIEKIFYYIDLVVYIGGFILLSLASSVLSVIQCFSKLGKNYKNLKKEVDLVLSNQLLERELSSRCSLNIVNEVEENILKKRKKKNLAFQLGSRYFLEKIWKFKQL